MQETNGSARRKAKKTKTFFPKDRVDHSVFGLGTIIERDERYTTIEFDESGSRKFVTSMVELAPSDTPAPAKRARTRKKAAR